MDVVTDLAALSSWSSSVVVCSSGDSFGVVLSDELLHILCAYVCRLNAPDPFWPGASLSPSDVLAVVIRQSIMNLPR